MTIDDYIGAPPVAEGEVAVRLRVVEEEKEEEEPEIDDEEEMDQYAEDRMKERQAHQDEMIKKIPF